NVSFTLSSGSGSKTVYVWFKDAEGNVSDAASDSITISGTTFQMGGAIQGNTLNIDSTCNVTTLAGSAGNSGSTDGTGTGAKFYYPFEITTDGTNLFVSDYYNHTIRKIVISTGVVTTIAGSAGNSGSTDATGTAARFYNPSGITTDGTNLFVSDNTGNHTIRKIVISTGVVTTLAGSGISGSTDGIGTSARFYNPKGITTDGTNLFVCDGNHTIRKIVISTGVVTTIAGSASISGSTDGTGTAARFYWPTGITTDGINLFVADQSNAAIRKIIISTGVVTTIAGSAGSYGSTDGTGTAAKFYAPGGITTDGTNLFVAEYGNHKIRKIVISTGAVTTLAGSGSGSTDGIGTSAKFYGPTGITTDGTNLFIADKENNTIRKIAVNSGNDTTPPQVSSTNPLTNATGVLINAAVTATFSEAMNTLTINSSTFLINGKTGTVTYSGTTATFIPTTPFAYNTQYTATITTGAKDAAGNALAASYTWTFTTETASSVKAIAAGGGDLVSSGHTIALKTDGTLWAWGGNKYGQLGDGTNTDKDTPEQIETGFTAIAAGDSYTAALKTDGTLWAWGKNDYGQLGDGTYTDKNTPKQIGTGFIAIAAGFFNAIALKTDGTLWAWGRNDYGQLGDGTYTDKNTPKQIGTGYSAIAAGSLHTIALKTDGTLWAWGYNSFGGLGDGTNTDKNTPKQIGTGYSAIAAGGYHTIALKTDGTLWAWGANYDGELGDGTTTSKNTPKQIGAGYSKIAAGGWYTIAIKTDGALWAWGDNEYGELGDGTNTDKNTPKQIGTGYSVIAANYNHAIALKIDGTLWAWGSNGDGQLGDGTYSNSNTPVQVSGL
ncbi:MAG: Ig-like domain-containing protein, partial [Candidatus Firestonebacteria bacterium]|nr:Ig-like domain-containing protein [Candidatus Firestonebacteria bacterium]